MSGCCNCSTVITFFLFIGLQFSSFESKNYRKQRRFTMEDVCKETVKTRRTVHVCPLDIDSARKRSKETKCEDMHDSCSQDPLVYHCVRSGNKLIEVCAPRNFISGKCCTQFNDGVGRIVEDYSVSCSECPFHYYSNESMIYPTCIQSIISLAAQQITVKSIDEYTSKVLTSHEPPLETSSASSRISPVRKKCRSGTGRRKRDIINCADETTTVTIHFNHTVGKKETGQKNGGGFIIVFVTFTVSVVIGMGAASSVFKGRATHDDPERTFQTEQNQEQRSAKSKYIIEDKS